MSSEVSLLIVEDEEDLRDLLVDSISELFPDFKIIEAYDGKNGLDKFIKNDINVILSDIKMPNLDGIGLLKEVRKINKSTPFIILTGHGNQLEMEEALGLGVYDFISKPCDLDLLEVPIKSAVSENCSIKFRESINNDFQKVALKYFNK